MIGYEGWVATGSGFELELPSSYLELKEGAERRIKEAVAKHPKARKVWEHVRDDPEVNACWDAANFIAVAKLNYNDHGEVHAKVVAANALEMLGLLLDAGVLPDVMRERAGDEDDVYLIVLAASSLHDIGNQVHRELHSLHSTYLAIPILNRLLPLVYGDAEKMYGIRGYILHAIYVHGAEVRDLTIEAALVGIADGTDMTKGRGRLAFDTENVNIHTVSALSIERVRMVEGAERPIEIRVEMSNSAGVFQAQEILMPKISHSPLEDYVDVRAVTVPEGDRDVRIVRRLSIRRGRIVPHQARKVGAQR
ncbi:MAG: phosphohydrolase [Thermoprotei archaeon]|nr:MAG: phosphohydrolase [Thermoprotei archaeon]